MSGPALWVARSTMTLVRFLPTKFSFCRATFARRVVPLRAIANLFWNPYYSSVVFFGSYQRRSAASFRSLHRLFFGSPTDVTVASCAPQISCALRSASSPPEVHPSLGRPMSLCPFHVRFRPP
jgi:hypothetical protein